MAKITPQEYNYLKDKYFSKFKYRFMVHEKETNRPMFTSVKPHKSERGIWLTDAEGAFSFGDERNFNFVKASDEEPWEIGQLLSEYEQHYYGKLTESINKGISLYEERTTREPDSSIPLWKIFEMPESIRKDILKTKEELADVYMFLDYATDLPTKEWEEYHETFDYRTNDFITTITLAFLFDDLIREETN